MAQKLKVLFDSGMNWQFIPDRFRELMNERFDCVFLDHQHLNDGMRSMMAKWADVIFADWALEWAQFYLKNFPDKRIIIRTHRCDVWHINSPFYFWENVDVILFMNNIWRDKFLEETRKNVFDNFSNRCYTVPRLVDNHHWRFLHNLTSVRRFENRLGMLGRIAPWKGCKEIADLMQNEFREFTLSLMGLTQNDVKIHGDYINSIQLCDQIIIKEHSEGDYVIKWFADVDFIISNSSVESWHAAITEGMLCGCVPMIRHWTGAEEMHPERFIFENISELVEKLHAVVTMDSDERKQLSEEMRQWCIDRYNLEDVTNLYADIIEGKEAPLNINPQDIILSR